MNDLIKEINSCLENKNYLSALALTLTLPDICGKISYPELKGGKNVKKRYIKWYDEYIYPYECSPIEDNPFEEWVPDGSVIYKLRCNLLHDGSLDVDNHVKEEKKPKDSYDYSFILTDKLSSYNLLSDGNKNTSVLVRIGVEDFCKKICAVVDNVYCKDEDIDTNIYNDIIVFDFD